MGFVFACAGVEEVKEELQKPLCVVSRGSRLEQ